MTQGQSPAGNETASGEQQLVARLREIRTQERLVEEQLLEIQARGQANVEKPNGAAVAAIIAASLGVFMVGLWTTLAEASTGIKDWLNFYNPTGPLSGKTTMSVAIWLAVWVPLHFALRNRELDFKRWMLVAGALIILGVLLTFPPVFDLFAS